MTPSPSADERATAVVDRLDAAWNARPFVRDYWAERRNIIAQAIREAEAEAEQRGYERGVLEEREACARAAEEAYFSPHAGARQSREEIASAIRGRPKP